MRDSILGTLLLLALIGTAAGCSSESGSGLTTGSLFGSKTADATPAAPKPVTPSDRVNQVAGTSAQALRCGFNFEPEQLKSSFFAAEQQSGTPPDQIAKLEKDYDQKRATLIAVIAKDDAFCTEGRARAIKASLTRHLAGDYSPPQSKPTGGGGFFDTINQGNGREVFVPGEVFNPQRKSVTRREE